MLCREMSLVKECEHGGIAIPLMCRSWSCNYCAPRRRLSLVNLAKDGRANRFITLTASPTVGQSPADRARMLARAWRVVVARAKRQLKLPALDYLAVFERTKRGEPHLHILARCGFIPQRWLSKQMADIMSSPVVDIRQVKSSSAAAHYITKYVGKEPHHFATCKRYWHTRGWDVSEPRTVAGDEWPGAVWRVDQRDLNTIWRAWKHQRRNPTLEFECPNSERLPAFADTVRWCAARRRGAHQPAIAEALFAAEFHMGSRA
jgi:hypothetical protein